MKADNRIQFSGNPACVGPLPGAGLSRRSFLNRFGLGLGGVALADLLRPAALAGGTEAGVLGGKLHFPVKAKRVIYLFMAGGPSQL